MNTGLVASRYARALLEYASQQGQDKDVYDDAFALMSAVDKPDVLQACLGRICSSTGRFLEVLVSNGRADHLAVVMASYIRQYREKHGITVARVVTASDSPAFREKILGMLSKKGCTEVELQSSVDPDLVGGFVLQVDDLRLDASVRTQIETLRREFEKQNQSII